MRMEHSEAGFAVHTRAGGPALAPPPPAVLGPYPQEPLVSGAWLLEEPWGGHAIRRAYVVFSLEGRPVAAVCHSCFPGGYCAPAVDREDPVLLDSLALARARVHGTPCSAAWRDGILVVSVLRLASAG